MQQITQKMMQVISGYTEPIDPQEILAKAINRFGGIDGFIEQYYRDYQMTEDGSNVRFKYLERLISMMQNREQVTSVNYETYDTEELERKALEILEKRRVLRIEDATRSGPATAGAIGASSDNGDSGEEAVRRTEPVPAVAESPVVPPRHIEVSYPSWCEQE